MNRKRLPKHYSGQRLTNVLVRDLLPSLLTTCAGAIGNREALMQQAWAEIVGPKIAPLTRPLTWVKGVLVVQVRHSVVMSALNPEKERLLGRLRERFPGEALVELIFRIG